jgi:subtilisin family serine protease
MKALRQKKWMYFILFLILFTNTPVFAAGMDSDTGRLRDSQDIVLNGAELPGKVMVKYKQKPSSGKISLRSFRTKSTASSMVTAVSFDRNIPVADKMAELYRDPNVEYVEPVYRTYLLSSVDSSSVTQTVYIGPESYMKQWGAVAAQLDQARAYTTPEQNQQVTVAVLDTGIDMTNAHFEGTISNGYDFVNQDGVAQDDNGHGTHVSGIITSKPSGVNGANPAIAPGVRIMPLKVLDESGEGDTASLIEALKYAIANRADIVNMSLGISGDSQAVRDIIREAYGENILMIAAAGNSSNHWIGSEYGQLDSDKLEEDTDRYAMLSSYPAAYEEVISVGAIAQLPDGSYAAADFSDVGKVDVVAPGVHIYSADINGNYAYRSGTSQAAPFVTGFAALLKAYNTGLDLVDIGTILRTSAMPALQPVASSGYTNFNQHPNDHVSQTMVYGAGLIQGDRGFQVPRLELIPIHVPYPGDRTVTYDVYMLNIQNTVVASTYQVGLEARFYDETLTDRSQDSLYGLNTGYLENGYQRLTATLSNNESVHHIYVYGYWLEPASTGGFYPRRSNMYSFISRPSAPQVSLASGAYTGSQQITVASPYAQGLIYYQLATQDGISRGTFPAAGGKLTLTKDSELTVAMLHANVFSEEASYKYVISPSIIGGGGGGGTFNPVIPEAPLPDGFIKPSTDVLLKELESSGKLLIDAKGTGSDDITIELEAAVLLKANQLHKSIAIEAEFLQLELPPLMLEPEVTENDTFQLKINKLPQDQTISAGHWKTQIYDFTITVNGKIVTSFRNPVQVTFQLNPSQVKSPHQTGVFTYNEAGQAWEHVGGQWDPSKTAIRAYLNHFSKYAVIEKNDTFADIQGHWAQKEIEAMAAWGTVDGMTQKLFMPEEKITRAQMAALLSKALKLKRPDSWNGFNDVTGQDWFSGYVYAAQQARIVEGIGNNRFAPLQNINREQLAVMLFKAYLYETGKEAKDVNITQEQYFSDEGTVSAWARSSVRIVNALGLMGSVTDQLFEPGGEATRAQAAAVIHRLKTLIETGESTFAE